MFLPLKNWKLALLGLLLFTLFVRLGFWQLARAQEKISLQQALQTRTQAAPLGVHDLISSADLRFYRLQLKGRFDNAHSFLLDNKTRDGQIGYEIYTPFRAEGSKPAILVDRGFIPASHNRADIPIIPAISGRVSVEGMLNLPPRYVALGAINESAVIHFPLRIEYVHLQKLSAFVPYAFSPYILLLPPQHPAAFAIDWKINSMSPEKHRAYAAQWFAFALTLLILFVALNWPRAKSA